jgi:hypothetical protein
MGSGDGSRGHGRGQAGFAGAQPVFAYLFALSFIIIVGFGFGLL